MIAMLKGMEKGKKKHDTFNILITLSLFKPVFFLCLGWWTAAVCYSMHRWKTLGTGHQSISVSAQSDTFLPASVFSPPDLWVSVNRNQTCDLQDERRHVWIVCCSDQTGPLERLEVNSHSGSVSFLPHCRQQNTKSAVKLEYLTHCKSPFHFKNCLKSTRLARDHTLL